MRKFVLSILAVLVTACAPMPQNHDLSSQPGQGLLVVSMRYWSDALTPDSGTLTHWASLTYRKEGALSHFGDGIVSTRDARIPIDGDRFARLNVAALPPGNYVFRQVEVAGLVADLRPPLRFTIQPGRATYLGMIEVRVQGMGYRLNPSDQQARDIPLLMKHWPGVKREAVDVQVLPRS